MRFMLVGGKGDIGFIACPFWYQHWSPTAHCSFRDDHRECFDSDKNDLTKEDCPMLGSGTISLFPDFDDSADDEEREERGRGTCEAGA